MNRQKQPKRLSKLKIAKNKKSKDKGYVIYWDSYNSYFQATPGQFEVFHQCEKEAQIYKHRSSALRKINSINTKNNRTDNYLVLKIK